LGWVGAVLLAPARALAAHFDELLATADADEALGALLAAESLDRQVVALIAEELLRGGASASAFDETAPRRQLAEARGRSSIAIARNLPDEAVDPAWHGARTFWSVARAFLADVYALAYCEP
jgi:hypothetical protein